jgi:uncharacterized protein
MANPISHVEISGTDANRLREFYSGVFDWHIQHIPEMNYNMVNAEPPSPSVGIGAGSETPYVTFYVQVADLQDTLNKVEAGGGRTIMPPTEIPGYVTMAMFTDPEGHIIGLTKTPR